MVYGILADAVVLFHLAFVAFVVAGGILVLRRPRWAWVHLPLAVWGALVEMGGWVCPLTPLEVRLRVLGGEAGYPGGFVEHYLLPTLYPPGLTRGTQWVLGVLVVVVNLSLYGWAWRRRRRGPEGGEGLSP
jgi:hypothetical protein